MRPPKSYGPEIPWPFVTGLKKGRLPVEYPVWRIDPSGFQGGNQLDFDMGIKLESKGGGFLFLDPCAFQA